MTSHGMDRIMSDNNNDNKAAMGKIFQWLYIESHFRLNRSGNREYYGWDDEGVIRSFGRDVQALTCVNKVFCAYLSEEERIKRMITTIAQHQKMCDNEVMTCLNRSKEGIFFNIRQKIGRLFDIVMDADKQFTQEDLQDTWCVNACTMISHSGLKYRTEKYRLRDSTRPKNENRGMRLRQMVEKFSSHTLLSLACKVMDFDKIQQLLAAGAKCNKGTNNSLLLEIAKNRSIPFGKHKNRKVHYFIIARLLLEHGARPDHPNSSEEPTALMIAVHNNDQEYALLLLRYFANPYFATHANVQRMAYPFFWHDKDHSKKTAFDLEKGEPKGWFRELVDNFEERRNFPFKYWFLKHYDVENYSLPLDVMKLIMRNVVQCYKGYNKKTMKNYCLGTKK